jgi:hypothetical protein
VDASDSSLAFPELCESAKIFWASSAGTMCVRITVAWVIRTSAQTAATPVAPVALVAGAPLVDGAVVDGVVVDGVVVDGTVVRAAWCPDPALLALVVELHDAATMATPKSAAARTALRRSLVGRRDVGGVNKLLLIRALSGIR